MNIAIYETETKARRIAKSRGWKFASSIPADGAASANAAKEQALKGRAVMEVLRQYSDCNGCDRDYFFFHR